MSEPVYPNVASGPEVAAAGATPAAVDVAALLARIQAMEAQVQAASADAAAAKEAATPKPPTLAEVAVNVADSAARHAFQLLAEHLGI